MTEQLLNKLNTTLEQQEQLLQFRGILPDNLIETAERIVTNDIPQNLNSILNLLNSINGEVVFRVDNNTDELIELFNTQQENLNRLFTLTKSNERIAGTNLSEVFTASQILETLVNGYTANCETISFTLIVARLGNN